MSNRIYMPSYPTPPTGAGIQPGFRTGGFGGGAAPTFTITGEVLDAESAAVEGVTITLTGDASDSTTTDENGLYTLSDVVAGVYTVTPTKTDKTFTPTDRAVEVVDANKTADFAQDLVLDSLPWGYTFAGQSEGVAFGAEWSDVVGGYATLTADSTGLEIWDPNQTVGHFRSDAGGAGKYCDALLDLGGAYDISGGFRFKIWTRLTQTKDAQTAYWEAIDAAGDRVIWARVGQIGADGHCHFYHNFATLYATATTNAWTSGTLPDWMGITYDVQPGADEVKYQGKVWNTDFNKSSPTQAMTAPLSGWNPNPIVAIRFGSRGANVWTDDIHTAGFWLGAHDDAFPANPANI